jgi:phosphate-selective porin OprO/OprP
MNTDWFTANDVKLFGAELAFVYSMFSAQAEYILSSVNRPPGEDDPSFSGYYIYVSCWLTGEHRKYKPAAAAFSRVKPKNNFDLRKGTWGAFELALRYSSLDLTDAGILGGELGNISTGINWHLNPHTRIMLNYVISNLEDVGKANFIGMRFQIDF